MTDLILAILHHILVFGLVAMLAMERVMLGAARIEVKRLVKLDGGYGATAGLIIVVGVCRVLFGGKGWEFYEANPFFWAKLGTFLMIGLMSFIPTLRFMTWARAAKVDPAFQPDEADRRRVRTFVGVEALLLVPLIIFAAAMARWPF
jgi:putative membrane protein